MFDKNLYYIMNELKKHHPTKEEMKIELVKERLDKSYQSYEKELSILSQIEENKSLSNGKIRFKK